MDHGDLVADMGRVEHLSTGERLALARRRRLHQLKVWTARDKEWTGGVSGGEGKRRSGGGIRFSDSVVLLEAASRNDIAEVRRLLMKGVSPDSTNEDGLTALHQCCIDDNEEMMKLLLEFRANVNAEDSEKWTPLHAAATCGHLHLVRYLIASGADLLAVNGDGNMAYDICEEERALEHIEGEMARRGVTQALIDETRAATETAMLADLSQIGAELEGRDGHGATPLHIAAANGYLRVVEFLLDRHVSTDIRDRDDWQPVHAAACWGHIEVLELLVQNGADLNAKTKHDETPADICEDAELRGRIALLAQEQQTRRAAQEAQQRRRAVKRSQSNNTRARSVRRTSLRDRGLASKKDAVEEARLRLQAQQVFAPPVDLTDVRLEGAGSDVTDHGIGEMAMVQGRSLPDGKDNDDAVVSEEGKSSALELPTEASYTTEGNGKINIHVSVTINAGTLADLKKQRAQNRNSSPDVSVIPDSARSSIGGSELLSPSVKRFAGNTSENVIGDTKTHRCCILC